MHFRGIQEAQWIAVCPNCHQLWRCASHISQELEYHEMLRPGEEDFSIKEALYFAKYAKKVLTTISI
jgi:hypothetical protein